MKKILFIGLTLVLILTGCGTKTDYQQLVKETSSLSKSDGLALTLGSTFQGTDSELDGTSFEINYIFDLNQDLFKMTIDDVETYLTPDTMYINLFNVWIQRSFDINQYSELKEVMAYKDFVVNMPDGDEVLGDNFTGIPSIDQAVSGKTLNQVVVSTGENQYTISGVEDIITADTSAGLKITINDDEVGKINIEFTTTDSIELPAEAESALSIDTVGDQIDGLVSSSEA